MAQKREQAGRALARLDRRPAAGSQAELVASDPVTVGPDRTITIDLAKLPAPSNVYDADFAWIEHHVGYGRRPPDTCRRSISRRSPRGPHRTRAGTDRGRAVVGSFEIIRVRQVFA
jgi:hypothetical protein